MPHCKHLAAAILVATLVASSARATVTATFVPVPITTAAKTADPTLNNYSTYDLQVSVSNTVATPDDWVSAQLEFKLSTGNFYVPSFNSNFPNPTFWSAFPYLEFDTFINGKDFSTPNLHTTFVGDTTQPEQMTATEVNAQWGDVIVAPNTSGQTLTYTIGRFTILNGSTGGLYGNVYGANAPLVPTPFVSTIPNITPEPTSLCLLGLGGLALVRRPNHRRAT